MKRVDWWSISDKAVYGAVVLILIFSVGVFLTQGPVVQEDQPLGAPKLQQSVSRGEFVILSQEESLQELKIPYITEPQLSMESFLDYIKLKLRERQRKAVIDAILNQARYNIKQKTGLSDPYASYITPSDNAFINSESIIIKQKGDKKYFISVSSDEYYPVEEVRSIYADERVPYHWARERENIFAIKEIGPGDQLKIFDYRDGHNLKHYAFGGLNDLSYWLTGTSVTRGTFEMPYDYSKRALLGKASSDGGYYLPNFEGPSDKFGTPGDPVSEGHVPSATLRRVVDHSDAKLNEVAAMLGIKERIKNIPPLTQNEIDNSGAVGATKVILNSLI